MAIKRCKAPFSVWKDGVPRVITGGQLIEDTDPVYKTHAHLFEDVETFVSEATARASGVEEATAAPGQKRSLRNLFAPDNRVRQGGEVHNPEEERPVRPAAFDPGSVNAPEVIAYLDALNPLSAVDRAEALRVLDAEAEGKKRSTVLALREQYEGTPAARPAPDGDDV